MNATVLALTIIGGVSGFLSMLGSLGIICHILCRKKVLATTYHRIMFGLSIMNFFVALAAGLSTIPAPRDTPGVLAFGNTLTCDIQGFISMFISGAFLYNFFLSVHYCLMICFNIHEDTISKRIEPIMHLLALGWPTVTAIVGQFLKLYNFAERQCWLAPYPAGCAENDEVECTRGINAYDFRWIFQGYIYTFFILGGIPVLFAYIVFKVWRDERQMQTYDPSFQRTDDSFRRGSFRGSCSIRRSLNQQNNDLNRRRGRRISFSVLPRLQQEDLEDETEQPDHNQVSSVRGRRRSSGQTNRAEVHQHRQRAFKKTKAVAHQGMLYMGTFYVCYSWTFVGRIIQQSTGTYPFAFAGAANILFPLEGMFNYFIFVRGHVNRIRRNNPDRNVLWAYKEATLNPEFHLVNTRRISRLSVRGTTRIQV